MKENLSKDKESIAQMFDSIAPKYNFLNHLLSFNIDRYWRKEFVNGVCRRPSELVLDLACGTGDISRHLHKKGERVIGMDISSNMLKIAKERSHGTNIEYKLGAADNIPFPDNYFDAITVSFGLRNFDKRDKCFDEMYRVIKKGGELHILEFAIPRNRIWRTLYCFYFTKILPTIGRLISSQSFAYKYLPTSTLKFPCREELCHEISTHSFKDVSFTSLTGGVACIYKGIKPAA